MLNLLVIAYLIRWIFTGVSVVLVGPGSFFFNRFPSSRNRIATLNYAIWDSNADSNILYHSLQYLTIIPSSTARYQLLLLNKPKIMKKPF